MTQHKDRKTKIRARMAADSISYTRAALLVDREAGQAPTRTIDCDYFHETYGEWLEADDDLIHNGVWDRASDQDREECGPCEHYDYQAIGYAWNDASAAYLASHGADWTWSGPGTSGTLTVPADKDDE
jgi:hypothetical protein